MGCESWCRGRRFAFVVSIGVVAIIGRTAYAQGAPPSASAERRFNEGIEAANAGDFQAALRAFTDAYRDSPLPRILFDIATAEEKLGRWDEAYSHYRLVAGDPQADSSDRADANDHLRSLGPRVGHVELRAPSLLVVNVDGRSVDAARLGGALDVAPGHHVITVRVAGADRSASVDVGAEQTVRVDIGTEPQPRNAAPTGTAELNRHASHVPAAQTAAVAVLGVLAGGAIGGAAYLAFASRDEASSARSLRSGHSDTSCLTAPDARCGALSSAVDRQNSDAAWSNRLYVAGGVVAAGAVVTWFLWPRPRPARWVVPTASANGFGLTLGGAF